MDNRKWHWVLACKYPPSLSALPSVKRSHCIQLHSNILLQSFSIALSACSALNALSAREKAPFIPVQSFVRCQVLPTERMISSLSVDDSGSHHSVDVLSRAAFMVLVFHGKKTWMWESQMSPNPRASMCPSALNRCDRPQLTLRWDLTTFNGH